MSFSHSNHLFSTTFSPSLLAGCRGPWTCSLCLPVWNWVGLPWVAFCGLCCCSFSGIATVWVLTLRPAHLVRLTLRYLAPPAALQSTLVIPPPNLPLQLLWGARKKKKQSVTWCRCWAMHHFLLKQQQEAGSYTQHCRGMPSVTVGLAWAASTRACASRSDTFRSKGVWDLGLGHA